MPELQRLEGGHAAAVLAFELANRAYFAASISDRGDEFYHRFTERHEAMLADQEAGRCAFYLLVNEDGSVLGRFNLYDIGEGSAALGYRVAEHVAGRGVATSAVRELQPAGGGAARAAHPSGGHLARERRVQEGTDQGRVCRCGAG